MQLNIQISKKLNFIPVDFVLKDPREKDKEKEKEAELPQHRAELDIVPKPWNRSYLNARDSCTNILHVTNPCMLQVLELWHTSFSLVLVTFTYFI